MQRTLRFLTARYLTFDDRSLGVFRILFGCVLLYTLSLRWAELDVWYTNDGLLPNHTLLWRPSSRYLFSLFFAASDRVTATLLMFGCALVFVAYVLGYRTRLFQILALVANVSLNSRISDLENGADMMANLLLVWTCFLPLGRRFSLDQHLASRTEAVAGGGSAFGGPTPTATGHEVVSLAVLALLLQFSIAYLFNALHKSGAAWVDGSAVHYVLHQDRVVTGFGVWVREHVPYPYLGALTRITIWVEAIAPLLLLSPINTRFMRLVAMLLYPLLHVGFRSCLNFGNFAITMAVFFTLLPNAADWNVLERWWARRRPRLLSAKLAGIPDVDPEAPTVAVLHASVPPYRTALAKLSTRSRELAVLVMMVASAGEIVNVNSVVPGWLRWKQPEIFQALIEYPRLLQGWRMFAPDAPTTDRHLHVDAVTKDGRHVDPYNEIASRVAPAPLYEIPKELNSGKFFKTYGLKLAEKEHFRRPFEEWILRYPKRTGNDKDRIVRFDVYELTDESPPPGKTLPSGFKKSRLFSYPSGN